jgi:ATP-binding cassette, subfamily B, bacterial
LETTSRKFKTFGKLKSAVRIADRIAVITGGKVSEVGSHQELMKAKGRYSELFELQAAGYR